MRLFLAIFLVFVAGSLAEQKAENLKSLEELHDPTLTKENPSNEDDQLSGSPSFDEVKRELESHGMLKNLAVIGLYRRGEEPANDEIRNTEEDQPSKRRIVPPALFNRPICRRFWVAPYRIRIGKTATLVIRRFGCRRNGRKVLCARCGKRYGYCEKTYTWFTIRVCYVGPRGWHWFWRSYRIGGCCQCQMHNWGSG